VMSDKLRIHADFALLSPARFKRSVIAASSRIKEIPDVVGGHSREWGITAKLSVAQLLPKILGVYESELAPFF